MGDFNVNYADSRNPARKNLTDFEALTGLKQLITQTTRFARSNSTIDLIYSNSDNVINSGTLHINVSDHEVIFVSRKKAREKFNIIKSYARSYVNYSKNEFQEQIRNLNWDILSHSTDVNEFWGIIEDNIRNTIENMCPLKRMKIKDKGDPWVTSEIIELIQDKDRLRIRAKRSESQADWNEAKAARNFTKQVIRGAKAKFISNSLDTHDKNPTKF